MTHLRDRLRESRWGGQLPQQSVALGALSIGYALAAFLSLSLTTIYPQITAVWLPTGVGIAGVLWLGPAALLAIFCATLMTFVSTGLSLGIATLDAVGFCLEALIGAALLHHVGRVRYTLERVADVFRLAILGGVIASLVGVIIGTVRLWLTSTTDPAVLIRLGLVTWGSHLIGALVALPLVFTWLLSPQPNFTVLRWAELLISSVIGLVLTTVVVFQGHYEYLFTIFPWLIWAAVRFGPRGASFAVLTLTLSVAWRFANALPIANSVNGSLLTLIQPLLGLAAVATLTLGALIAERERAAHLLAFLADASQQLGNSLKVDTSITTLGALVVPKFADWLTVARADYQGRVWPIHTVSRRSLDATQLAELTERSTHDNPATEVLPILHTIQTGRSVLFPEITDAFAHAHRTTEKQRELLGRIRLRSLICVPLLDGEHVFGVMVIATRRFGRQFFEDDLRVAEGLAQRIGQTIVNSQLYSTAQEVAHRNEENIALLDTFLTSLPIGVAFLDKQLRYQRVNAALARLNNLPVADHIGRTVTEVLGETAARPIVAQLQQVLETGVAVENLETHWESASQPGQQTAELVSYYPITVAGQLIGVGAVVIDITERRRLEMQLLQARKLESIGRLAGGIAHDFNNILTAVIGYADLIITDTPATSGIAADARDIRVAAQRAARLTSQLLAFARKQILAPRVVDLNTAIAELLTMLRRVIGDGITLEVHAASHPCTVQVDLAQFEQVLVNMVVNARDAMAGSGALRLQTCHVLLDEAEARHLDVRSGLFVQLTVSDTGHGMSAAVQQRIFEPFFTTKPTGSGSGLGLATSYGIVRQSGGQIDLTTAIGIGTTFRVLLPAVSAVDLAQQMPLSSVSPQAGGGAERVLLVEDESVVRDVGVRALQRYGYRVDAVDNGQEALRLVEAGVLPRPDLLLTDIAMPLMNGHELAARLRARFPGLKVLFVSGYDEQLVFAHSQSEPTGHLLSKPFAPDDLVRRVRAILDGTEP